MSRSNQNLSLDRYKKLVDIVTEKSQEQSTSESKAQVELNRIVREILAGKTTGDRIKDFVIVQYGPDDQMAQGFHDLEAELVGKRGELALIVTCSAEPRWYSFMPDPNVPRDVVTNLRLGVLTDEKLVLSLPDKERSVGMWRLPTGGTHVSNRGSFSADIEIINEDLWPGWRRYHVNPVRSRNRPFEHPRVEYTLREHYELEIHIGNGAVEGWFKKLYPINPHGGLQQLKEMREKLSTLVLTPEE